MNQQTIICSNCKTPNPARNLYCQSCGRPLIAASPYVAPSDATQPPVQGPAAPPQPPAYTTPPPPQYPPAPEQQAYVPPAPPAQYPPPPAPDSAPVYPDQVIVPQPQPVQPYVAPAPYQAAPAQPDFFQKTQARAGIFVSSMKKETFNVHADGWSELVAGEGEKAAEIEQGFVDELTGRGLTNVDLERVEVTTGLQQRAYQVARHRAGSVTFYASAAGKDLMLGWDLHVVQKPSWKRLGILALAAFILSFLVNLAVGYSLVYFVGHWIFDTFNWAFPVAILGLIAGKVIKGDLWYMFVEKPEEAALQELSALAMAVHQCLLAAVMKAGLDQVPLRAKDSFKMS